MGKPIAGISREALARLREHDWPGNIRELENAMERAVALEQTPTILAESLPEQLIRGGAGARRRSPLRRRLPGRGFDLERHVQDIEREYIAEALRRAGGVKVKAAELLGMSFRSFRYYTKKYNLQIGRGPRLSAARRALIASRRRIIGPRQLSVIARFDANITFI